ncbi:unnamed protein product [Arabis nemorensis]|uniref:Homeobox domain-containing protein n=1 Tax=Arabis nemorensis TaxID=586526 RepID=A0A565C6J7_9BRAS|nr:unnamed protein product [Arabis nemorensis]
MQEFADRVNWKMQKRDEDDVRDFCRQIGVDKSVLKVWMHNNKNNFNRRDLPFSVAGTGTGTAEIRKIEAPISAGETKIINNNGGGHEIHHSVSSSGGGGGGGGFDSDSGGGHGGNVNGSSSS